MIIGKCGDVGNESRGPKGNNHDERGKVFTSCKFRKNANKYSKFNNAAVLPDKIKYKVADLGGCQKEGVNATTRLNIDDK